MKNGDKELEALAKAIADQIKGAKSAKPKLRLVETSPAPAADEDDEITRQHRINRVRWLQKIRGLRWLVDQHCFGQPGLESLSGPELRALHRDMEKANDCIREGIPCEDAGLIRSQYEEAV
jgi:hypothetical protein